MDGCGSLTLASTPACTTDAPKMLYASKNVLMKDIEAYAEREELMLLRMSCAVHMDSHV